MSPWTPLLQVGRVHSLLDVLETTVKRPRFQVDKRFVEAEEYSALSTLTQREAGRYCPVFLALNGEHRHDPGGNRGGRSLA